MAKPLKLLGLREVAELAQVTKQAVLNWRDRKQFPKPYAVLHCGPIWLEPDVVEWLKNKGTPAEARRKRRIIRLQAELAKLKNEG